MDQNSSLSDYGLENTMRQTSSGKEIKQKRVLAKGTRGFKRGSPMESEELVSAPSTEDEEESGSSQQKIGNIASSLRVSSDVESEASMSQSVDSDEEFLKSMPDINMVGTADDPPANSQLAAMYDDDSDDTPSVHSVIIPTKNQWYAQNRFDLIYKKPTAASANSPSDDECENAREEKAAAAPLLESPLTERNGVASSEIDEFIAKLGRKRPVDVTPKGNPASASRSSRAGKRMRDRASPITPSGRPGTCSTSNLGVEVVRRYSIAKEANKTVASSSESDSDGTFVDTITRKYKPSEEAKKFKREMWKLTHVKSAPDDEPDENDLEFARLREEFEYNLSRFKSSPAGARDRLSIAKSLSSSKGVVVEDSHAESSNQTRTRGSRSWRNANKSAKSTRSNTVRQTQNKAAPVKKQSKKEKKVHQADSNKKEETKRSTSKSSRSRRIKNSDTEKLEDSKTFMPSSSKRDTNVSRTRRGRPSKKTKASSSNSSQSLKGDVPQSDVIADKSTDRSKRARVNNTSAKSTRSSRFRIPRQILSTPSRNRRSFLSTLGASYNHKLLLTGYKSEAHVNIVTKLGATIIDDPGKCTILVTDKVQRTYIFLCCVARGIPIVSFKWLDESLKAQQFLDWEDYILEDSVAEAQYKFNLQESLEKAHKRYALKGYTVLFLQNSTKLLSTEELEDIVALSGGKPLFRAPTKWPEKIVIITKEDKLQNAKKLIAKAPKSTTVHNIEILFTGILRQELNLQEFKLFS